MIRFHVIDDAAVILRRNGVYRQSKVFRRGDALYAAYGAGFLRLMGNSGTSVPSISWDDIDAGCETMVDRMGRLTVAQQLKAAS